MSFHFLFILIDQGRQEQERTERISSNSFSMQTAAHLLLTLLLATAATATNIRSDASGPSDVDLMSSSGPADDLDLSSSSGPPSDLELSPPVIEDPITGPPAESLGPVEVARQRLEKPLLPTGLEGQDWFWKKLATVTSEIKYPVRPEFKVEAVDPKRR